MVSFMMTDEVAAQKLVHLWPPREDGNSKTPSQMTVRELAEQRKKEKAGQKISLPTR